MVTPVLLGELVWWIPIRHAAEHKMFFMLGDHGYYCPIAYGGV